MKKLSTKKPEHTMKPDESWMLPNIHVPHADIPEAKKHEVGESHMITVKATKTREDEQGSSYKVTHIHLHPKKASKRYPLKQSEK